MIVGFRQADLSISVTANLLEFLLTTVSIVYSEWRIKEKTSSEWHLCGNALFLREVSGEWPDWFELTESYCCYCNQVIVSFKFCNC